MARLLDGLIMFVLVFGVFDRFRFVALLAGLVAQVVTRRHVHTGGKT